MIHDLKPYPSYKDSGVPWLGKVPEHWKIGKVRDIARVINGYPFDSSLFSTSTGYPLIRIRDLNKLQTATRFDGPFVDAARVEPGEVLIGMDGDFNVGTWRGSEVGLLNQRMCCIRGGHPIINRFLLYLLPAPLKRINEITRSTTVKHLASSRVEKIQCGIPSEDEQSAIVHYLDHIDRRIRHYIRAKKKLIKLLEEQKQAIIHQAVTRGLDPNVKLKPSGVEWLGDIPEHWDVVSLRLRYTVQLGKMLDSKKITGEHLIPYLRNTDVQWDRINTDNLPKMDIRPDEYNRYTVKTGDLLVCEGGEVGRAAIWVGSDAIIGYQKALHRLRPLKPERDEPRFVYFVLFDAAKRGIFHADGSENTIAHLTGEKLRRYRFVFPPVNEQKAIIKHIDLATENMNQSIYRIEREISLLREYRTLMIADVVTGKLDVREAAANLPEKSDEMEVEDDFEEEIKEESIEEVVTE